MRSEERAELKYYCSKASEPIFRAWLQSRTPKFRMHHPARWVYNIYFDDLDQTAYWESISGSTDRRKFRLRWYADQYPSRLSVEIKEKRGNLTRKSAQEVTLESELPRRLCALRKLVASMEVFRKLDWPQGLFPSMANCYFREYFLEFETGVRMTLDHHIRASELIDKTRLPSNTAELLRSGFVVEFKFDTQLNSFVRELLSDIPLRRQRFSKYCEGLRRRS